MDASIRPAPQIAVEPGPALPALQVTTLDSAGVDAVLTQAAAAGLVGADRELRMPTEADPTHHRLRHLPRRAATTDDRRVAGRDRRRRPASPAQGSGGARGDEGSRGDAHGPGVVAGRQHRGRGHGLRPDGGRACWSRPRRTSSRRPTSRPSSSGRWPTWPPLGEPVGGADERPLRGRRRRATGRRSSRSRAAPTS